MPIRRYRSGDRQLVISLIAQFRVTLAEFKGITRSPNLSAAEEELDEYIVNTFPIFVAEEFPQIESSARKKHGVIVGYLVCRVQEDVVWAESLYVQPAYRRHGLGTLLYQEAEKVAQQLKCDTLYNWVHPNNHKIISFLQKRGYTVLNLLEIRKPHDQEPLSQKIAILDHEFDY